MDTTLVITVNGEEFPLSAPSVQEVREVKRWTGFASRPEWFAAIIREDADAILAAYVVSRRRKGEQADFNDKVDFAADPVARWVDGQGREVEPAVEKNTDGTLRLTSEGMTVPILDEDGNQQWRDVESGTVLPFESKKTTGGTGRTPSRPGDTEAGPSSIVAV